MDDKSFVNVLGDLHLDFINALENFISYIQRQEDANKDDVEHAYNPPFNAIFLTTFESFTSDGNNLLEFVFPCLKKLCKSNMSMFNFVESNLFGVIDIIVSMILYTKEFVLATK